MKVHKVYYVAMIVALLVCSCDSKKQNKVANIPEETQKTSADVVEVDETISIITLGDNLLHMPVVNSGKKADGTYEYSHLFENLQPRLQNADIAVIGQETVFGGEKHGYSGYPL